MHQNTQLTEAFHRTINCFTRLLIQEFAFQLDQP